jgi:hypothetical protein
MQSVKEGLKERGKGKGEMERGKGKGKGRISAQDVMLRSFHICSNSGEEVAERNERDAVLAKVIYLF